jgi:hypothetical protein
VVRVRWEGAAKNEKIEERERKRMVERERERKKERENKKKERKGVDKEQTQPEKTSKKIALKGYFTVHSVALGNFFSAIANRRLPL